MLARAGPVPGARRVPRASHPRSDTNRKSRVPIAAPEVPRPHAEETKVSPRRLSEESLCRGHPRTSPAVPPAVAPGVAPAVRSQPLARSGTSAAGTGRSRPSAAVGGSVHNFAPTTADPHCLHRFTDKQRDVQPLAMREVLKGRKETCWMWFIIPTPPHFVNGVERGSSNNRRYALRSDEEARAYLAFEDCGVALRTNYIEMLEAVKTQLSAGRMPFGRMDEPKLKSSLRMFERISREESDADLHDIIEDVAGLLQMRFPS